VEKVRRRSEEGIEALEAAGDGDGDHLGAVYRKR
jgi:hypothetical protein